MATLQIQLLRDFQISYQGKPLDRFDSPRVRSLLAYLLLHRDAPQSRKHLAFLLWQDSSEQQAHGNLRKRNIAFASSAATFGFFPAKVILRRVPPIWGNRILGQFYWILSSQEIVE